MISSLPLGMVYMSSSVLSWEPILKGWLQKISAHESSILWELFDSIFEVRINFLGFQTKN